jgi:hypothetical protein
MIINTVFYSAVKLNIPTKTRIFAFLHKILIFMANDPVDTEYSNLGAEIKKTP